MPVLPASREQPQKGLWNRGRNIDAYVAQGASSHLRQDRTIRRGKANIEQDETAPEIRRCYTVARSIFSRGDGVVLLRDENRDSCLTSRKGRRGGHRGRGEHEDGPGHVGSRIWDRGELSVAGHGEEGRMQRAGQRHSSEGLADSARVMIYRGAVDCKAHPSRIATSFSILASPGRTLAWEGACMRIWKYIHLYKIHTDTRGTYSAW